MTEQEFQDLLKEARHITEVVLGAMHNFNNEDEFRKEIEDKLGGPTPNLANDFLIAYSKTWKIIESKYDEKEQEEILEKLEEELLTEYLS